MIGNRKRNGSLRFALVTMIICSLLLSACSSKPAEGEGNKAGGNTSGKKVTLKVEVFDRGNSPKGYTITDNYMSRWVQENFGKPSNIDVEYVPVPRSEEVEKLNVLMASASNVPDIVFTYDTNTFNRYAKQGGLTDLTKLIDEYGPNLKAFLGDDVLQYGKFGGEQLAIPAKRSNVGKYASFIRQDWLDKLSLPMPQTTDELYAALKAFKEKDPGKTGGQVIPFGMTIASAQYEPLLWSFIKPLTDEQKHTMTQQLGSNDYPVLLPGFKEGLQFMNKLYNEGMMSKDFGLDKDKKKLYQDVTTGLVGFFSEDDINVFDSSRNISGGLAQNVPGGLLSSIDTLSNEEGKYAKPIYAPIGLYIMIPKSSERAIEAIKYLDWMASGDNLFKMQNGVEGENYTLVNDIPVNVENQSDEAMNRMYNSGDVAIISNGKQLGSIEKNLEARALQMPQKYQDQARVAMKLANTDSLPPVLMDRPIEAQTKYGTTLLDKFNEIIVKTTMAKPDQFESVYTSMLKDYMASGGQAILDERTKVYNEMKSK